MRSLAFLEGVSCCGASGQVRRHEPRGAAIKEGLHPDLKRKKLPDLHRPILCASAMLIHKTPHRLRAEQARGWRIRDSDSNSSVISFRSLASQ